MKVCRIVVYREGNRVITSFKCPRCGKPMIMWGETIVVCSCSYFLEIKKCLWSMGIRHMPLVYVITDILSTYYRRVKRLARGDEIDILITRKRGFRPRR